MSFNREIGIRLDDDGVVRLSPEPRHEAAPGTVHFAILATLGEVAAAQAAAAPVVPTHLSVQLVRRAAPGVVLEARGCVLKAGRTLIFAQGEVSQGGKSIAHVTVTFARAG